MAAAQSFNAEKWKALKGNGSHSNPRIGMVGAAKTLLHAGMSQDEVVGLLGEPDGQKDGRWTYDLGASPYGADYQYLVLEFDGQGKLASVKTEQG